MSVDHQNGGARIQYIPARGNVPKQELNFLYRGGERVGIGGFRRLYLFAVEALKDGKGGEGFGKLCRERRTMNLQLHL